MHIMLVLITKLIIYIYNKQVIECYYQQMFHQVVDKE